MEDGGQGQNPRKINVTAGRKGMKAEIKNQSILLEGDPGHYLLRVITVETGHHKEVWTKISQNTRSVPGQDQVNTNVDRVIKIEKDQNTVIGGGQHLQKLSLPEEVDCLQKVQ